MTTQSLDRLNVRIDILYRNISGEPVHSIAARLGVTPRSVERALSNCRNDARIVNAAKNRIKSDNEWKEGK